MFHRTRRGFLLSLVVPLTLSGAACSKVDPSQKIADQFIENYYVNFSVKEASKVATGLAKQKLEDQLQLIGASPPDTASEKPRVTFSLVSRQSDSADEATYVYKVKAHIEDVGERMVYVKVRQEAGKWLVSQYSEQQ